jgi:hypothetical protein
MHICLSRRRQPEFLDVVVFGQSTVDERNNETLVAVLPRRVSNTHA